MRLEVIRIIRFLSLQRKLSDSQGVKKIIEASIEVSIHPYPAKEKLEKHFQSSFSITIFSSNFLTRVLA